MSYPEIVSTIALVVSLGSLGVAAYNSFRDRPRLKIISAFYEGSEWNPAPGISVNVVNHGRRPVILRLLGGYNSQGQYSGVFLEHDKGGIRLGEHERHDFSLEQDTSFLSLCPLAHAGMNGSSCLAMFPASGSNARLN
jgi:hypothetical protein